jgi:hypothetical protein
MPWTLDLRVFELALIERSEVVRAQVVDGVVLALDVAHGDLMVTDFEHGDPLQRDV